MKKSYLHLLRTIILVAFFLPIYSATDTNAQSNLNNVPSYYYANYNFINDWNAIWEIFSTIKARNDLDMNIDTSYFSQLHSHFSNSFRYLTKDYNTTYEKCLALTSELSNRVTYSNLQSFL